MRKRKELTKQQTLIKEVAEWLQQNMLNETVVHVDISIMDNTNVSRFHLEKTV